MTPPCPYMVIPLAWQLLSKTLLRPKARVELSVLPLGVNAGRVAPIVVSWKNGMLRRRPLSSDSPGPLLDSSYAYNYGLMALTHRWQNRHLRVPLNSVFPDWTFETPGTGGLLGFLFCSLTPQFGLWTGLHVRSSAWSLNLAGCMRCS